MIHNTSKIDPNKSSHIENDKTADSTNSPSDVDKPLTSNTYTSQDLNFLNNNSDHITPIPPLAVPKWKVLLPFGSPAKGASVTAIKVSDDIRRDFLVSENHFEYPFDITKTTTLEDGSFEISDLPPATYLIHAELDGYSPGHIYVDLIASKPEALTITLGLGKNIFGCVTDIDNNPLPDITVEASLPYLPYSNLLSMPPADAIDLVRFHGITKTDAKGMFYIHDQPLRNLYLTIEDNLNKYANVLRIIPESDFSEQKIFLRRKCTLEGHVKDKENKPIKDVEIWDITFENGMTSCSPHCAISDNEGFFKFNNTREGNVYIHATHPEYGGFGQYIFIQYNRKNTLDIVLQKAITKQITVTDTNNKPLNEIDIIVEDSTTGVVLSQGKTDNLGIYKAESLIPGNLIIVTVNSAKSSRDHSSACDTFIINDDSDLAVQLTPLTTFTFNIIDSATNALIPNVYLYLTEGSSTDSEFSYALEMEPFLCKEGEASWAIALNTFYTLHIVANHYEPKTVNLLFNESDRKNNIIDITLNQGNMYCGIIVDAITNSPIPGATVSLNIKSSKSLRSLIRSSKTHSAFTNINGQFNIESLPSDYFTLSIVAPGYSIKSISSYLLQPGSNPLANTIHIEHSATILGKLYRDRNLSIESGIVELISPSNELIERTHTAIDGSYIIENAPCGRYYLRAFDYAITSISNWQTNIVKEIKINSNEINNIDFVFSGTSSVYGSCKVGNKPGIGFLINLINTNDNTISFSTSTEEEGLFLLHSIIAGEYIISATSTMDGIGCSISKSITLNDNTHSFCDFDFTDLIMTGKVFDNSGEAICGCSITVSDNKKTYHSFTDYYGTFNFYNIPHGNYILNVTRIGFSSITEHIEISDNNINTYEYTIQPEGILNIYINNNSNLSLKPNVVSVDYNNNKIKPYIINSNIIIHNQLSEGILKSIIGGHPFSPTVINSHIISGQTSNKTVTLFEGGYIVLKAKTSIGLPIYGADVYFDQSGLYGFSWEFYQKNNLITVDPVNFTTSKSGQFKIGPLPTGTYTLSINYKDLYWSNSVDVFDNRISTLQATLK